MAWTKAGTSHLFHQLTPLVPERMRTLTGRVVLLGRMLQTRGDVRGGGAEFVRLWPTEQGVRAAATSRTLRENLLVALVSASFDLRRRQYALLSRQVRS